MKKLMISVRRGCNRFGMEINMNIFISHSSKDAAAAEEICRLLEEKGNKCFIAPRDIRPGKEYAEELINGLEQSEAVVLLMSQNANQSPHVLREVEHAVSNKIPILVYKLEDVVLTKSMEYFLMTHQWIDREESGDYREILDFVQDFTADDQKKSVNNKRSIENIRNTKNIGSPKGIICRKSIATAVILFVALAGLLVYGSLHRHKKAEVQVGDTVLFGSYHGEDIAWRVLKLSEDGTQAVLVSKDILTMKAFDAAESGTYNRDGENDYWSRESAADTDMELQARVRGNSDWSVSNLRTWLNSDSEVVDYKDQPPMSSAMAEKKNGYNNEPGFLYDFTDDELEAIVEQENVTKGNGISKADTVTTYDRVYLLSAEELSWFDEAGISKWAVPVQTAVEHDDSGWYLSDYNEFGIKELSWWLREPDTESGSLCYLVDNGYTTNILRKENAGLEGFGVRPALTVDLGTATFRDIPE